MKKHIKLFPILTILIISVFSFAFLFPSFKSDAATLDALYFFMSRMKADLDGSTPGEEVEYILAIAPNQNFDSGGTVTIFFPLADSAEWCRTATDLTATGITASAADLATTDFDIDAALTDTGSGLTAACTQGNGTTTVDTITISAVGVLTAATTYGVKIESGTTGVIGTSSTTGLRTITVEVEQGTTLDSMAFSVYIIANDQVVVSATVSAAPSVNCSISTNTVDIGTLYPGGSFATATHTIGTSSSNSGYYWAVYGKGDSSTDAGLYKVPASPYLIASTGSTTIDLTGGNAEGFGMTASDPDTSGTAVVATTFQTGTLGQFGALDITPAGAKLLLSQPDEQASNENSTITYGARASSAAVSGSYSETVTFVCGGYY